jgi:two-component system, NarL family, sensor histidine kinase UhpB
MKPAPRPPASPEPDPSCLAALMRGSLSEIYLIDAASARLVDANPAACANSQYARAELAGMDPLTLAPALAEVRLDALLAPPDGAEPAPLALQAELRRRDGSRYTLALRLLRAQRDGAALIVAIGEPLPAEPAGPPRPKAPGLAYQFVLDAHGAVSFPYLSEGCLALLGLASVELQRQPQRFLELILEEDRQSYLDSMRASKTRLWNWNWEGRIWIDAWKDVKWINLRSTPQALADGSVRWDGVMSNITESRQERVEVRQSRDRLAELTAHIETVKEQERSRIAREIHDELGGNLTAIKMALAMLARRLDPGASALQEKAAYVDALIDRSIDAVHRIALDLRPSVLDFGIVAALEWQVAEFGKQAGVACDFSSNRAEIALDPDHATALFRIAQEALTNVAKHAHASRVTVRLARLRHHVSLKITDNGAGLRQADRAKPQSFGLRGMAERANALGGTLTLGRAAGGGTVVTIKIGLAGAAAAIIAAGGAGPAAPPPSTEPKRMP